MMCSGFSRLRQRGEAGVVVARHTFDPAGYSLRGFFLTLPAIGALGVVVITGGYANGAASPQGGRGQLIPVPKMRLTVSFCPLGRVPT
jgi:hypothetical protein